VSFKLACKSAKFKRVAIAALSTLAGSIALNACSPTPVATTTPSAPASASPKPTTSAPVATASPTPSETPTATPKTGVDPADKADKFAKVTIDQLEAYKHKSGVFEMQVPKGWKDSDSSKPGEVIVLWTDPTGNALIGADIFTPPAEVPSDKLPEMLERVVRGLFGTQPDFEMGKPQVQPDGSVQIVFSVTATSQGIKTKLQGNSFIEKKGDKISILTFGSLESQFDGLKASFTQIANSQKVNLEVKVP
jgi:hypothetical protein